MTNKDLLQICATIFAAILAASITAYLSLNNKKNGWISILRNEMAGFIASTVNMSDSFTYIKHRAAIELLLSPKKKEQDELIKLVDNIATAVDKMHYHKGYADKTAYNKLEKIYSQATEYAIVQYRIVVKLESLTWIERMYVKTFRKHKTVGDMM